jgi:acetyltransferase-like isoleucine patch superfamily enzyme
LVGDKNRARFVAPSTIILGDPEIGEGTWCGHFTILDGVNAPLKIGKNCSIASGVHIYTHSTHELVSKNGEKKTGAVTIGDNVSIGANSVILYDVYIGDNVVIPALTLVKPHTRIERNDGEK